MTLVVLTLAGCGSMKTTTEEDTVEVKDISTVSNYSDSRKILYKMTLLYKYNVFTVTTVNFPFPYLFASHTDCC